MKTLIKTMRSKLFVAIFIIIFLVPVANAASILWSADSSGQLGTVDVVTGDVNVVGKMGVTMTDIAFDPKGNLWGITFDELYKIDKETAKSTRIGSLGASVNSLIFDTSGTLYTANSSLYTVDTATGAASRVGNGGETYKSSGDLAFIDNDLFLSSQGARDNLVKINTLSGSGSLVGNIGFSSVYGLASPNRDNLFGMSGFNVLSINPTTGNGTSMLNYSGQGLGQAWGTAFETESMPTPIPAAIWLFGSGLVGLIGLGKRRKTI
jgi:hypothetical protein